MNRLIYARLMVYNYGLEKAHEMCGQVEYLESLANSKNKTVKEVLEESAFGELSDETFTGDIEFVKDIEYVSNSIKVFIKALRMYSPVRYDKFKEELSGGKLTSKVSDGIYNWILTRIKIVEKETGMVEDKKVITRVNSNCRMTITIPLNPTLIAKGIILELSGGSFRETMLRNTAIQRGIVPETFAELNVTEELAQLFKMSEYLNVKMNKVVGPIANPDTLTNSNHMFFSHLTDKSYFMMHPIVTDETSVGELVPATLVSKLYSNTVLQDLVYRDGIAYTKDGMRFMDYVQKL